MAWGDLRFDHSDIFGSRAQVRIGARKDAIGPGHPQWEKALEMISVPGGATVSQIGAILGHKHPKTTTARLLNRMTDAGVATRRRGKSDKKGTVPFFYYKA